MQPGSYRVAAELSGFASVTLQQVTVALSQRASVTIQMKLATLAENITVTGESASIVETLKTDMSTRVNERAIQELPINVRNPLQFILITPATTAQRTTTGSGYSFGGSRARNNSSVLDGVDNNDDSIRGFLAQPSLDAVKEFQVMASNFTAEYGRASGGVVNTILKSGTNQFHGSGFYFLRDRTFAANNFFTNANPNNPPGFKPYFRQQQPGLSLGGPLQRNELFFFTSYEHFRTDSFNNVTISPANAEILNNVLAGRYDLVPNLGPNFPRDIELGFDRVGGPGTFPAGQRRHILVEKVDWQTSPSVAVFARYLYNRNRTQNSGSGLNDNTRNTRAGMNETHSIVGSYTHIISPRTLNEFRVQYQWFTTGGQLLDNVGPGINISGVGNFGRNLNQPQGRTQTRYQFIDNYSLTLGRHELKTGFDINRVRIASSLPGTNAGPLGGLGGVFTFANMAAFLDGNAVNFLQGFGESGSDRASWHYGLFIQDTFRPTDRLTLNAGLRWEMQTMPEVVDVLDPTPHRIKQARGSARLTRHPVGGDPSAPGDCRRVQPLQHGELHELQHRVGLGRVSRQPGGDVRTRDGGRRSADRAVRDSLHVLTGLERHHFTYRLSYRLDTARVWRLTLALLLFRPGGDISAALGARSRAEMELEEALRLNPDLAETDQVRELTSPAGDSVIAVEGAAAD